MSECKHNELLRIDPVPPEIKSAYTCPACGEIFNPPTIQEIEDVPPLPKRTMDPDGFSS